MAKKNKKKGKIKQKLTDKYRLVVLNEDTFEERFSLKLSRLNVFVLGGVFSILLVAITTVLIAFTQIKEYIPGYSSTALKRKAANLTFEADSLKTKLAILENYTKALKPVLTGDIEPEDIDSLQVEARHRLIDESLLDATKEDSLFREKVDESPFTAYNPLMILLFELKDIPKSAAVPLISPSISPLPCHQCELPVPELLVKKVQNRV